MTLKPIPGAPIGAPIPDFPTGQPGPVVVPAFRVVRHAVEPEPSPAPLPARQPGPIEIRGDGNSSLTFRCIPEVPAINRSSMNISISNKPAGNASRQVILDLATDKAKAFLLGLRDGTSPIAVADERTAFQVEFVVTDDGSTFIVSKPGEAQTVRWFNVGRNYDVAAMAAHLLADLGP